MIYLPANGKNCNEEPEDACMKSRRNKMAIGVVNIPLPRCEYHMLQACCHSFLFQDHQGGQSRDWMRHFLADCNSGIKTHAVRHVPALMGPKSGQRRTSEWLWFQRSNQRPDPKSTGHIKTYSCHSSNTKYTTEWPLLWSKMGQTNFLKQGCLGRTYSYSGYIMWVNKFKLLLGNYF